MMTEKINKSPQIQHPDQYQSGDFKSCKARSINLCQSDFVECQMELFKCKWLMSLGMVRSCWHALAIKTVLCKESGASSVEAVNCEK